MAVAEVYTCFLCESQANARHEVTGGNYDLFFVILTGQLLK